MEMTSREEITDYILKTNLLRTCVECQVAKAKDNRQWIDDIEQDMWVWLLTYDIEKLSDAYEHNHMSALLTKVLINQIYSVTSPLHKTYRKFLNNSDEITDTELNIADE